MKFCPIVTLPFCLIMIACSGQTEKEQPNEIIKIDVLKAFDNQKNIKASEFIQDIEFIPLESSKDAWFRYAYNYLVSEKYVMVIDGERAHMVLFDRQGNFIRTIGTKGEGPGELLDPREATMDLSEGLVFVYDGYQGKLVKFTIEGEFVKEIDIRQITPAKYITGIQFINKNEFVLVNYRPFVPMEGFASLPVFDRNLNHVKDILGRANDENLRINVEPHALFTINPERMTFWEPYMDTLYTITPGGSAIPTQVIGFSKNGPNHEFVTTNINPNSYAENSIVSILDAGQYFHILGRNGNRWFTALYNKKTKEIFEVVQKTNCDTSRNASRYGFENDLYGAGKIWLRNYSKTVDRFVTLIDLERFSEDFDLECIRQKEVKFLKLRDRFLELVKDPEARFQKLIVLMKAK